MVTAELTLSLQCHLSDGSCPLCGLGSRTAFPLKYAVLGDRGSVVSLGDQCSSTAPTSDDRLGGLYLAGLSLGPQANGFHWVTSRTK